jgi:hypothetical protein
MARQLLYQPFNPQVLAVQATPTPFSSLQLQQAYIDTILLTVYTTAANSVFFGDQSVTVTNGIEIPAGTTIQLSISNERPLYEIQNPLIAMVAKVLCIAVQPFEVPFIYWDVAQLYAVAAAPTNMIVTAVKRAWV